MGLGDQPSVRLEVRVSLYSQPSEPEAPHPRVHPATGHVALYHVPTEENLCVSGFAHFKPALVKGRL